MMRGILRYESRAGAGPMHTSSSAKRTWSDSRSASEYTATVCIPSSRQARMTRRAISPRFAIRTFLNMASEGSGNHVLRDRVPRRVAGPCNSLDSQRELAWVRRVIQGVLVRDDALLVPVHERLVEALHAVLDGSLGDELGDVQRFRHVADVVAHRGSVDQNLGGRHAARLVRARNEAQRHDGFE